MDWRKQLASWLPDDMRVPAHYWYQRLGRRLEAEMALVPRLLRSDSVAVDIGANVGIYTYAMHRRAKEVHAFEPVATCAAYLSAFARRVSNVMVHQIALSDHIGRANLDVPMVNGRPNYALATLNREQGQQYLVDLATLDSFNLRDVSLIKIDVEGHERAVLNGAINTVQRERPALIVEIEERHTGQSPSVCIDWVRTLGYDLLPQLSPHNYVFVSSDRVFAQRQHSA